MEADAAAAAAASEREAKIEEALRARVPFFKKQADSLTLEGVRRTLEKDMDLEKFSLDAHKKFIKQSVDKIFSECDYEDTNNASEKAEAKYDNSSKERSEDGQRMSGSNKVSFSAEERGARSIEAEKSLEGPKDHDSGSDISEAMIKKAIDKRASYLRDNSETLTLLGVRRTLEEDLKLEKKGLDAYKSFITTELDRVLQEPANGTPSNKKESRKDANQKTSKGSKRAREDSDTSEINDRHSEREDSDEGTRPKKRGAEKSKAIRQQKAVTMEKKLSTSKVKKVSKQDLNKSMEQQGGNAAKEHNSHSSDEEDSKKIQQSASVYGKQVERLKSIIKACGMSVAPSVYRRAKQAPESKREAYLIKELENILAKEGLSSKPSEKEIKAVKKRKERAKDLEGIDMSNIITSSRRRSTSNFIPLPVPRIEAHSDDDDDDDDDDDADDDEIIKGGDEGDNDDDDDDAADDHKEKVKGVNEGDNDDAEAGDGSADDAEKESA